MTWVIVAILVVVVVVLAVLLFRSRRSQQLQKDFGPEYGRVLADRGERGEAESELAERRDRRAKLEIRDLEPAARERYAERWAAAQRTFVDQPAPAVAEADALVSEVMRERAAHGISVRAPQGDAGTEDLRQAMVHFRALFDELLGRDERVTTSNANHERTT